MENNYVQRKMLGKFVDSLISQKYPDQPLENFKDFREKSIDTLSNDINNSLFEDLNRDQLAEINALFDNGENNPAVFEAFFEKNGVDPQQKATAILESFKANFLGGTNE